MPTTWEVEQLLRENIREAQGRMERDVLLFGVLFVVYVVLASAHIKTISAAGVTITQPQYAQFALVPYAVLTGLRFAKAQAVRDSVYRELKRRGSLAPKEASVLDWSLSGDRVRRYQRLGRFQSVVTPAMMLIGVVAGYAFNFVDADGEALMLWAILTLIVGLALLALMGSGRAAWSAAFYWAPSPAPTDAGSQATKPSGPYP